MAWLPFVFIALGMFAGFMKLPKKFFDLAEPVGNIALIVLMLSIGINIGSSDIVIKNIGSIGLQCLFITFCAFVFSIIGVFALEKTILPLGELQKKIISLKVNINSAVKTENDPDKKSSFFIRGIPVCLAAGIVAGVLLPQNLFLENLVDKIFIVSLMVLYISVGIGLSQNRHVFAYVKLLGWKIILISAAIVSGSLIGGFIAGLILGVKLHIAVLSACGMSYYSLTGAFMTQAYGITAGTYGFLVNVMREFFTVLLLPLWVRLSKGAPIACGGAADMDTLLIPVTKFIGAELGLIVLITGTVLTFAVPVLLQLLSNIFNIFL